MADTLPTETLTMNYEKVEWTYSKSKDAGDSFDFTATPVEQKVGLLLPAVQQVREPSSLPPDEEDQAIDSFKFAPAKDDSALEPLDALLVINQLNRSAAGAEEDDGVQMADGAVVFITDSIEAGDAAYEYKLDGVMISSYDVNGAADADHDRWIDVLSTDWGTSKPDAAVAEAGLRSDGELVQAVSEADMGGDFIL